MVQCLCVPLLRLFISADVPVAIIVTVVVLVVLVIIAVVIGVVYYRRKSTPPEIVIVNMDERSVCLPKIFILTVITIPDFMLCYTIL